MCVCVSLVGSLGKLLEKGGTFLLQTFSRRCHSLQKSIKIVKLFLAAVSINKVNARLAIYKRIIGMMEVIGI